MRAAVVVALLSMAACGGDDGSGFGVGNVDIEDAPAVFHRALCHHAVECGLFPDEATCLAANIGVRFVLDPSLVAAVRAGRVKYDGNKIGDCYEQFGDATCDRTDVDGRSLLAGCAGAIEGTVGDGGACALGAECVSGVCNLPQCPDACCAGLCVGGTVRDREAEIGEPCTDALCALGSYCANGTCAALEPVDSACTSSTECDYGLGCAGTPRTCRSLPALGAACAPDITCRDEGQYCHPTTMVCTPVGLPGDACSTTVRCSSYYECSLTTMQCERGPAIGEACSGSLGCFDAGTYCKANVCARLEAVGSRCERDNDCESNLCGIANTCTDLPTCP